MKLLLYYAGMANDANHTEQIGVALSSNSTQFTRIGDGLIIPRDPLIPWKNLRTCNPAVLKLPDGRFAMFYQGVGNPRGPVSCSTEPQVTSIGLAFSEDGMRWECEPQPILSYKMLKELDPAQDPSSSIGLIEPSVIYCNGLCQIWFVYVHRTMPGNALIYATSRDLRCWDIRPMPILTGCDFGGYDLFYPQVVQRPDGFELWFTLRNSKTGVHGIFRMQSVDGIAWSGLLQVMPPPVGAAPDLRPRALLLPFARLRAVDGRWRSIAKRAWNAAVRRGTFRLMYPRSNIVREIFGYAHPHVIGLEAGPRLYFHYCNLDERGLTLDIGCGTPSMAAGGGCTISDLRPVLLRAEDRNAWDGYFVADPFVIELGEDKPRRLREGAAHWADPRYNPDPAHLLSNPSVPNRVA